jgi:hypothetical protein
MGCNDLGMASLGNQQIPEVIVKQVLNIDKVNTPQQPIS